jgi:hypothetical protein
MVRELAIQFVKTVRRFSGSFREALQELRDLLVVSIGDSAASGQGNPDIPGSPEGFDPDIAWWEVFFPPLVLYELSKAALILEPTSSLIKTMICMQRAV